MQFWSVNNFDVFMCRKWHCKLTVIESINHKQVSQWWLHSRWELLSLKGNDGSSCWNVSLTFESSFSFCNWPRLFLVKMTKDGVSGWFPITGLGAMLLIRLSVPPEKTYWLDVTSNSTPPPEPHKNNCCCYRHLNQNRMNIISTISLWVCIDTLFPKLYLMQSFFYYRDGVV